MPVALQELIPPVRGRPRGTKQPGLKQSHVFVEEVECLRLTDSQLPGNKKLSCNQRFTLRFSRALEQFQIP